MNHASLFSGIGGFDLAARWMGWENVLQCEIDPFCQKILRHHFPTTTLYGDIRTINGSEWKGKIDIITGGFPCQPFSFAGKRGGASDNRFLWPEMLRTIREIQPSWVVAENVRGIFSVRDGGGVWYSTRRALIWKIMDMKCNRFVFLLLPKMLHTKDKGFGLLPTPTASEGIRDKFKREHIVKVAKRLRLKNSGNFSLSITEIILLHFEEKINISFVEEMMGYPIGWTDSRGWETPLSHK